MTITPAIRDCALLLALPRSLDAIQNAFEGNAYADYVGRGRLWGNASELWERTFESVANAANSLAAEARHLGVWVTEDATLESARDVFNEFPIVTVVAHWRGPAFSKDDILLATPIVTKRLLEASDHVATHFRTSMPSHWVEKLRGSEEVRRSRLAELIDKRLRGLPALTPPPDGAQWHMDASTIHHFNRAALDDWWPEAFRAGNRLELADGLHSAIDIGNVVSDLWTGVADLSNCQSAQIISAIKRYRPDRIVIANELETDPISRMAALRITYDLVARGWDYVEARHRLADVILQHEREETRR
ncbi:hypothetical protein ACQR1Y_03595 [Bradyrhizobium sp. HKCCYLRH3099]|uniref:hypothetical protein n=1 Tax=unclassified Bradyrhizobium TaxID=2631580 RepID=UPI003EB6B69C